MNSYECLDYILGKMLVYLNYIHKGVRVNKKG